MPLVPYVVDGGVLRSLAGGAPAPDPDPGPSPPADRLSLLVTSAELSMWQQRSTSGPFRTAGDFSTNSPGHWTEMNAARSLDFTTGRWSGPTSVDSSGRLVKGTLVNDPPYAARQMASDLASAAAAALIANDAATATRIMTELDWYATRPNLDFANQTRWPRNNWFQDQNPLFMVALWTLDLMHAYDYLRAMGRTSAAVAGWFGQLGALCEATLHSSLVNYFPNRRSDSYTSAPSNLHTSAWGANRAANGTLIYVPNVALHYNNRRHDMAGAVGFAGLLTSNTFLVGEYKRYVRETVYFGSNVSHGQLGDANRGSDTYPQLGLSYALTGLASLLPPMEALARQGDTTLYDFVSDGTIGSTYPGFPTRETKSMQDFLGIYIRFINRTMVAQYTRSKGWFADAPADVAGNPAYRVTSRATDNGQNREMCHDGALLMPAIYYGRGDWINVINRVGTPTGFTSPPKDLGTIAGWRVDRRNRFLRSATANPYGGN